MKNISNKKKINDILKFIFDNDVTRSKQYKKLQESKNKPLPEKLSSLNKQISQLAEDFKQQTIANNQYVNPEDLLKKSGKNKKEPKIIKSQEIPDIISNNDDRLLIENSFDNVELVENDKGIQIEKKNSSNLKKEKSTKSASEKFEDLIKDLNVDRDIRKEGIKVVEVVDQNKEFGKKLEKFLKNSGDKETKKPVKTKALKEKELTNKNANKKISESFDDLLETIKNKQTKSDSEVKSIEMVESNNLDNLENIKDIAKPINQGKIIKEIKESKFLNDPKEIKLEKLDEKVNNEKLVEFNKDNQLENEKIEKKKIMKTENITKNYPHEKIGEMIKLIELKEINKIMSYDTIQIIAALKYIDFQENNIESLINTLSYIRKKKQLKIYDFPEIQDTINYLMNYYQKFNDDLIISFFYSLAKMKFDNEAKIYSLLNEISIRAQKLSIRNISNLTYGMSMLQLNSEKKLNFDNYFRELEASIIQKLFIYRKVDARIDTQSIGNIILSYCKTQNGSIEFYRILEEFIEEKKESFNRSEIAYISYSYANNPDCTEKVLEIFKEKIIKEIKYFQPNELCSILRAFAKRKILFSNEELVQLIVETFVDKYELMNSLDVCYFYSILAGEIKNKEVHDRFLKYSHITIQNLAFSFTGFDMSIIFKKIHFMQDNSVETFEKLKNQLNKLMKKNDIKAPLLLKVYENTKGLKFEGKYDLFNESIEKHFRKLKYTR